jgi:hypothetical protein
MVPGARAANLPMVRWEGFPYGNTGGAQTHREVVAELAADSSNGIVIGNPMMADSNGRGAAGTRPRASKPAAITSTATRRTICALPG